MRVRTRVPHGPSADVPAAGGALLLSAAGVPVAAGHLELPAPAGLALTAGWNFAESLGLPLIAYLGGERLGGQGTGMAAATAMVWLTAAARKVLAGSAPDC